MRRLTIAMRARNLASRSAVLVKHLGLPAQGVPFELLDGDGEIRDRQIGHELPVDRRTVRRRVDLKGTDVGEKLRTISLLLADWRQGFDGSELHLHARRLILSDRDVMASRPSATDSWAKTR